MTIKKYKQPINSFYLSTDSKKLVYCTNGNSI